MSTSPEELEWEWRNSIERKLDAIVDAINESADQAARQRLALQDQLEQLIAAVRSSYRRG